MEAIEVTDKLSAIDLGNIAIDLLCQDRTDIEIGKAIRRHVDTFAVFGHEDNSRMTIKYNQEAVIQVIEIERDET